MVGETTFCDYQEQRDSLSTSIPPISKIAKMDKNGLLKNDYLRLTNIF